MCGIVGYIDYKGKVGKGVLDGMTESLAHRGPDDGGEEIISAEGCSVGLGHRRLSIIDLTDQGHQPMRYRELSIVFNGEIYNYGEIRRELEEKEGCRFSTQTDTEVILQSFYKWGVKCIDRFIGMFAMGLYDGREDKLYLIRDRAGVKPLFYYKGEGLFLFGSELKAFHKHQGFKKEIDRKALGFYLQYGYIGAPYSIFKNARKVLPGHYGVYNMRKREYREQKYWDVYDYYNKPKLKIAYKEAKIELERILKSSFEYRMVSDVPVGVFLSGGYDSSVVTAMLQKERTEKIKTFTIGFREDGYNEAEYAKEVAKYLGTDHREYYCTEKDALWMIPELPYYYDEPMGDASAIPTMLVSRMARKEVTVALSADGGDEVFAGYKRYQNMQQNLSRINRIPKVMHKPAGKIMRLLQNGKETNYRQRNRVLLADILLRSSDAAYYNLRTLKVISDEQLWKLTGESIYHDTALNPSLALTDENGSLERVLAIDYQTYLLNDILVKVDRATMSVSLEGREPLLDHRIIEFAAQLPANYKYDQGIKKRILRDITHDYLPKELMDRPKMGFAIPLSAWLRNDLKGQVNFYLDKNRLDQQGILQSREVGDIIRNFNRGEDVDSGLIWFMLMFQMWHEQWME